MTLEWIMVSVACAALSTRGIEQPHAIAAGRVDARRQKRMRPLRMVWRSTQESWLRGATITHLQLGALARRRPAARRSAAS